MSETMRDQLNQQAREQDYESMVARLTEVFGSPAAFKLINRSFDMLDGKTPAEVLRLGSDEERYELECFVTYAETTPWYLQGFETQQE